MGVMAVTHAVVGGMVERGYGRIVTVISDAGRVGEADLVVYSGAKAGAAGFMRGLAKAAAPHGVTANCVALAACARRPSNRCSPTRRWPGASCAPTRWAASASRMTPPP